MDYIKINMKNFLLVGSILITLNGFAQIPNYVPQSGLHAWYAFSGNASDESVGSNDGVINGANLATDRFGNTNSCYNFDGVDDNIEIQTFFIGSEIQSEVSYSYWFNMG